jgi:hypothetical protein
MSEPLIHFGWPPRRVTPLGPRMSAGAAIPEKAHRIREFLIVPVEIQIPAEFARDPFHNDNAQEAPGAVEVVGKRTPRTRTRRAK